MNQLVERPLSLSARGYTPYQIAGILKCSYQRIIDVLKANDYKVNQPTVTDEEVHRLAEIRHVLEDHQELIRQREQEWL